MSNFWSGWIIVFTVANIIGIWWLLRATAKHRPEVKAEETTGHSWDGITEYNTPLPRWWLWLFYGTIIFAIGYLILYPGLGSFAGTLGWTQHKAYQEEVADADAKYGELYRRYASAELTEIAQDPAAMHMGQRLFLNNCAQCHGSDARGAAGFPNLADDDWLYGGSPEVIKQSINHGRSGVMPAMGTALGQEGVQQVVQYVRQISGGKADPKAAAAGEQKFMTYCAACHSADGSGNQAMGAPNLTDDVWLYGGSDSALFQTIISGRNGRMPAQKDILSEDKVHLLSAYIYSLTAPAQQ